MPLDWFNLRGVAVVGAALADQVSVESLSRADSPQRLEAAGGRALEEMLRRADRDVRPLRLNFLKRAKLANSFKWRLLEKGVEKSVADEVTQALLVHLLLRPAHAGSAQPSGTATAVPKPAGKSVHTARSGNRKDLLAQGNASFSRGEYAHALECYEGLVRLKPRSADALSNVGATLCKLSRFPEAEDYFRRAIRIKPDYPEAHTNLGVVQQWNGLFSDAEASFRRTLKLRPSHLAARSLLGNVLAQQGRLDDAQAQLDKVLKTAPKSLEALIGMAQVATMWGRFEAAETWLRRALEVDPDSASAWAALAGLRKMTAADRSWLERAQQLAGRNIAPTEESALRFAIGKYFDDLGDFNRAFESYRQANELAKQLIAPYRRDAHARFVDDLIRTHTRESLAALTPRVSESDRPVFIIGLMRSGTTLAEQIIGSHPMAAGAGELGFWSNAGRRHEAAIRKGLLDASTRKTLAEEYLRTLSQCSPDALRVLDKAPVNADYLGVIHSVFPNARIIHMRRNPIDTCLSCYFQQFSQAFNFTLDLSDLAYYYRQHHRLMAHWHDALPPQALLEVRYEDLVADPAAWTRRMLEFIGLEWDDQCLQFYKSERVVATASAWQVRQALYGTSVDRWRNYEKHIGPLLSLKALA